MTYQPSVDSDQPGHLNSLISLHCPHVEALGLWQPIEYIAITDQSRRMLMLIWFFPGRPVISLILRFAGSYLSLWLSLILNMGHFTPGLILGHQWLKQIAFFAYFVFKILVIRFNIIYINRWMFNDYKATWGMQTFLYKMWESQDMP